MSAVLSQAAATPEGAAFVIQTEPGSYRDRTGCVFYRGNRIFRGLSKAALENWEALQRAPFFEADRKSGKIVDTWSVDPQKEGLAEGSWAGIVEHARIPFISYPYEWPFGMLKDAALLHLDLMCQALACGMILRDSSPYSIQWNGVHPAFVHIPSFAPLRKGEPWVGYRQFCELFLYPLMLQAYKGADFRPWLRGRIDGIPAEDMRRLMSARDLLRPGVLLHVVAQSALQQRYSSKGVNVKSQLATAGFDKSLIKRNVNKLADLVAKLVPPPIKTEWSDYDRTHSYDEKEFQR